LVLPLTGQTQSDNFDAGTLDAAWKRSQFNPALVNLSFPDVGSGKALRIQAAPVPDAAPAAAMIYRDDVYTDFYVSVDMVDWPGTDLNQAVVLLARATLSANPATTTGVILNYDTSQYGENPTDRRQGQLQINMITNDPPFATKTIAVAEVTLQPGRPYRFVFQGVGSKYTGQVYDLHDLTQPVVQIEADDEIQGSQPGGGNVFFDGGFKSGVSGILSFSRQGTVGLTDVTLDNYYAGPTNPVPTSGIALAHPIPGTPIVASRVPAQRFQNFHDPAAGLSWTLKTFTNDEVNGSATRLLLNGLDRSSQLLLPPVPNGNEVTLTLPGSALTPNTLYSAQLEVQDTSGAKRSTNTFWFDTFSEAFLSSTGVKTIEAEDYNFDNGQFQADPIPVSGVATDGNGVNGGGVGYWELQGFEGVDFHDTATSPPSPYFSEYRSLDPVGHSAGMYPEISDLIETAENIVRRSDHVRAQYASQNLLEHVVHRTEPGEWLNYTRTFTAGTYSAYLRVASFGATEVELHQVTSDPTQPDQTTALLGRFQIPNQLLRSNYRYIPLVNDQGAVTPINLSNEQTLRLQMAGTVGQDSRKIALNYLLLVPFTAPSLQLLSAATVNGPFTEESGATVNAETKTITVPRSGDARYYVISSQPQARITNVETSGANLVLQYE
jgi:hypothetical protein